MKKYLFFAIAAAVFASCSKPETPPVPDEEIDPNTIIEYTSYNGTRIEPHSYNYDTTTFGAIIVSNTCKEGMINSPGTIQFDSPVTRIGDKAFFGSYITGITIPDSVTSIGDYAFHNSYLSKITLPNSIISIGQAAFQATCLLNITIPDSVISIGAYAFAYVEQPSFTLPDSITAIEEGTFAYCFFLQSIILGKNIQTIGDYAFSLTRLSAIDIPDSVTSIGKRAFEDCEWLGRVIIGKGIKSIGYNAFDNCQRLLEIYCKAAVPPVLGNDLALGDPRNSANYKIYVPQESVDAYKSAWSNYSDYIVGYEFEE